MNNLQVWEDIFQNQEWGKYPHVGIIKFIAKNFYKYKDRKSIKVLELGAGTGANLWFCAREGFSVYALEGSDTAMEILIQRFKEENLQDNLIETLTGDYYTSLDSITDNSIDAIIDMESLYCNPFDKTKEIIKKSFEKLKSSGVMCSITFDQGTYGIFGEEIDYHAVIPTTGPMGGKGFTRYTTKEDIEKLYKLPNNEITNIERQELHLANGEAIKEWIIELKKV